MHDEWGTSRTNYTKEHAAVSGHVRTMLNQADENEFIGQLLAWQQLSLEELLETPAVLALVDIEDGIGVRFEPVGLPKSHDQAIKHREGVPTFFLSLHDKVILLLGDYLSKSMHLLPQNKYGVPKDIVDCVNYAVIHKMSRQRLLPEEVIVI
jgi:hypothetical protein